MDPLSADTILFLRATSRPLLRNTHQSYIARQRVVGRATSPSTSTTLEAPTIRTRSFGQSGLIPGGKDVKKGRKSFSGVLDGRESNVHRSLSREGLRREPRIAVYKHNWKRQQNTVYWCNLFRVTQSEGLQFYQTRSNAIILYNTLLAMCNQEGGGQEVRRRMYNKTASVSCSTAKNCTEAELEL